MYFLIHISQKKLYRKNLYQNRRGTWQTKKKIKHIKTRILTKKKIFHLKKTINFVKRVATGSWCILLP